MMMNALDPSYLLPQVASHNWQAYQTDQLRLNISCSAPHTGMLHMPL